MRLHAIPLDCALSPTDVLRTVCDEPWPFALTGSWGGGGAIVGSNPLIVADARDDPFALVDSLPSVRDHGVPGTAIGGGWFGWLGYRLGRRIETVPAEPPRPVTLPDFHLAYYDHLLHLDPLGRWWFEALVSPDRARALKRRLADIRRRLAAGPPSTGHYVAPQPFCLTSAARAHHLAAVTECRQRIIAGEIFQANICLRLETRWRGLVEELFGHAIARVAPPYGALFKTPWGGIASLSPELFLRRRGDGVTTRSKGRYDASATPRPPKPRVGSFSGRQKMPLST